MAGSIATKVVLPLVATGIAGLTAGGMMYITLVEAPGRQQLSPSMQLIQWRSTFPRAKNLFMPLGLALVPTLCSAAYCTQTSLFYIAAIPFASLIPFTGLVLADINRVLEGMNENDVDKDDGRQVSLLVRRWSERHAVRSMLSMSGFSLASIALAQIVTRTHLSTHNITT